MIRAGAFRGAGAILMENDALSVAVLPGLGGKLASIYRKDAGFELLFQNPKGAYGRPGIYDAFDAFDASGFDDAFPTIDRCTACVGGEAVEYPDHGEIWSAAFGWEIGGESAVLEYRSRILPCAYRKTVSLDGDGVTLRYRVENTGGADFPCLWAMHCLIRCEENMELLFPPGTAEVMNALDSRRLGPEGALHPFPSTRTPQGAPYRLDRVAPASAGSCEKYYVNGPVSEGFCGAYYPRSGVRYAVRYDAGRLPYLGFWVTQGAFRGDYNCALEPATGFYDSVDKVGRFGRLPVLKARERVEFDITVTLDRG